METHDPERATPEELLNSCDKGNGKVNKIILVFLGLLMLASACGSLRAEPDMSYKGRVPIYNSCMKTCLKSQNLLPENKPFLSAPFIFESYCSCNCGRAALQISTKNLYEVTQENAGGKGHTVTPGLANIGKRSSRVCSDALFKE